MLMISKDSDLIEQAYALADSLERGGASVRAEILDKPQWHAIITHPQAERVAAAHLMARRFGVYLPEAEVTYERRGRRHTVLRPLLPGYLLVSCWGIERQLGRIHACPGVFSALFINGHVAVVPDRVVQMIQARENERRPIVLPPELVPKAEKPKKKRWRHSRAATTLEADDCEFLVMHAFSPFLEELRRGASEQELVDACERSFGARFEDERRISVGRTGNGS